MLLMGFLTSLKKFAIILMIFHCAMMFFALVVFLYVFYNTAIYWVFVVINQMLRAVDNNMEVKKMTQRISYIHIFTISFCSSENSRNMYTRDMILYNPLHLDFIIFSNHLCFYLYSHTVFTTLYSSASLTIKPKNYD